jgi:2-hydroxychromene-2-carboxylate isomerase
VLRWRYGDQLRWRHVMIGLGETADHYRRRGTTGESQARGYRSFRRRGMPFATAPRHRPHATWPMCRVVVAARRLAPDREWAVFRAFQLAQFTTVLTLDDPAGIERALSWVPGIDAAALVEASTAPETEEQFAQDRALARSAAGSPTEFQDRSATTPDGEIRYTAPSLIFTTEDERSLEVGGFQPVEAYDVAIANLDRSLERRPRGEDARDVLAAFPDGLTTAEVAAVMAPHLQPPDRDAAEDGLIAAVAAGAAERLPFGNDALWLPV